MVRIRTFSLAAALFVGHTLLAQGTPPNPANENDIRLHNGQDAVFTYSDPSDGQDFLWKAWPATSMRSCTGTMEITGIDCFDFDTDFTTVDIGGLNTYLADMYISRQQTAPPPTNAGQIVPDQADPNGVLVSFGPAAPLNNVFLTDPGCPGPGQINGYELDVDLTGGAGVGSGITVTADGTADTVLTAFVPGGGFSLGAGGSTGGNACGLGDYPTPDGHSTDQVPGGKGEEQFDFLGTGYSAFGGFEHGASPANTELPTEVWCAYLEFGQSTLVMNMNSAGGQGVTEGLHGIHYNCPAGLGGSLGARLYDWDQIGASAAVVGTASLPLPSCLNFKGGKLGLSPLDPLFNVLLGVWSGSVTQHGNDHGAPQFSAFDNGEFTTASLPLPAQLIPVGVNIPLSFQGFTRKPGQPARGTQITTLFLHG